MYIYIFSFLPSHQAVRVVNNEKGGGEKQRQKNKYIYIYSFRQILTQYLC